MLSTTYIYFSFFEWVFPAFLIGFLALCFWWRWWLLVPVGVATAIFAKAQYVSVVHADGPGKPMGVALFVFLALGAASGGLASAFVVVGRAVRWKALKPLHVLTILFVVGFGSFFAYTWVNQKIREAHFAAPSSECLNALHPARLGDTDLRIPVAPGLFLWGTEGPKDFYILQSNPDARSFCSRSETQAVALSKVDFNLDGAPSRWKDTKSPRPFCSQKHPEYPWAEMACNFIASDDIPVNPVQITVSAQGSNTDWKSKERETMLKSPVSTAPDGHRSYRAEHDLYLERPDGFFARCQLPRKAEQVRLYCTVDEALPNGMPITYDFRTTEALFMTQSPVVAANARAIFDSLRL